MTHHLLPNDRNNWIKQIQEQQNCKNAVWDILSMQGEYFSTFSTNAAKNRQQKAKRKKNGPTKEKKMLILSSTGPAQPKFSLK